MLEKTHQPISPADAAAWLAMALEIDSSLGHSPESSPPMIDNYRLEARIGSGTGGTVYRAVDESSGEEVAVKLLRGEANDVDTFLRFRQEARILSHVRHPNIAVVRGFGTFEFDGRTNAYIVMDLVAGPHLGEWRASPSRTAMERIAMMEKIASAVEFAHRRGVIHRDLKPSNVRIGSDGEPIVLDFGIAHVSDPDTRATGLETATGRMLGTPAYMAPEQIGAGSDAVDTRFDVYALGVMTFELLAGSSPIEVGGLPFLRALETIRTARPARLGDLDRTLRGDIEAVVDHALAKAPGDRYASAGEFAVDLRRIIAGESVGVRLAGPATELLRIAKRYKKTAAATLCSLIVVVTLLVATARSLQRAWRADAEATQGWTKWLDFAADLQEIEVSAETRRAFASFVADWSADLDPDAMQTDERKALVARTLDVMSDIELAAGRRESALEKRLRCLLIVDEIARTNADDLEAMRRLSRASVKVGDLHKEAKDYSRASIYYDRSFEIDRDLLRRHPGHVGVCDDWAWTLLRRATLLTMKARHQEATPYYDEYESACRQLVSLSPTLASSRFTLGRALLVMAGVRRDQGLPISVISRYVDEALEVARALVGESGEIADYRRLLNQSVQWSARIAVSVGDQTASVERIDEAAAITSSLLRNDPQAATSWALVTDLQRTLVAAFRREGESAASPYRASLRALVVLDVEVVRRDPEFGAHRDNLIADANELFIAENGVGDSKGAAAAVQHCLDAADGVVPIETLDSVSRILVARALTLPEAGSRRNVGHARLLVEAALQVLETTGGMNRELYDVVALVFDAAGDGAAAAVARERARNLRR